MVLRSWAEAYSRVLAIAQRLVQVLGRPHSLAEVDGVAVHSKGLAPELSEDAPFRELLGAEGHPERGSLRLLRGSPSLVDRSTCRQPREAAQECSQPKTSHGPACWVECDPAVAADGSATARSPSVSVRSALIQHHA